MDKNNIISKAILLIKQFEGFRNKDYQCSAGRWTIGYGTTIYPDNEKVSMFDSCTEEIAEYWLRVRCSSDYYQLERLIKSPTTDNQAAAMLSLMYNIGIGNFSVSSVIKNHNLSDYEKAAESFLLWNKITKDGEKIENKGLTSRRMAESAVYRQIS